MSLRDQYLDWPSEVSIETFAKCNAACTFCPYPTLERIGTKMPDEMIERIIHELRDHPGEFMIAPFKVNEPFLDKRMLPLCRMINDVLPKAWLRLFSNGSTLTAANIAGVAALDRVVHMWVSLNEHEAGAYRDLMGLDFDRTCANLDSLHKAVGVGDFRHPVVVSKVRALNERDDAFVAFCNARWPLFKTFLIKRDSWTGYTVAEGGPVPAKYCGRWFDVNIMATGKVALCCMDGAGSHAIGDLNTQSLFEVYNQREQRDRRLNMLSRLNAGSPCSGCNY